MLIVALTGGIGSGKSVVARYFAELGAKVIDADQLAREVVERGSTGFDQVVAAFGDDILRNGDIDRRVLGDLVFNDLSRRRQLEAIIHPLVQSAFASAAASLGAHDVLIYEIPLLVETDAASRFDYVITVEADEPIRTGRLKARGMQPLDIQARMSAQATADQRIKTADYVIRNHGTLDDLLLEVEFLWESVLPTLEREKT